jgi:ABC-type polar amino acid transport system ATPase subunit
MRDAHRRIIAALNAKRCDMISVNLAERARITPSGSPARSSSVAIGCGLVMQPKAMLSSEVTFAPDPRRPARCWPSCTQLATTA